MTKKDKEEMYKLINDVRYQLLDKIEKLNRPSNVEFVKTAERDIQRDTYEIVRKMYYEMDIDREQKVLDKMKQEKKNLEEKIRYTEKHIARQESNYYNNYGQ